MADEYVISVVLEGKAGGAKRAIKSASDAESELQNKTIAANVAFVTQLARMEALTSGLNQTIGGIDKMTGGLERTGVLSKEGAEKMRKFTGALQAIAGPLEVAIALKKLHIAITGVDTGATKASTSAIKKQNIAVRAMSAAWKAVPLMLVIFGAILLYKYLMKLDAETGKVTATINSLKESFDGLKDSVVGAGEAVNDFMDNIVDVAMGDFSSIGRLLD
jgi:predicted GTPase